MSAMKLSIDGDCIEINFIVVLVNAIILYGLVIGAYIAFMFIPVADHEIIINYDGITEKKTIPDYFILIYNFLICIFVIIIVEVVRKFTIKKENQDEPLPFKILKIPIPRLVVNILSAIGFCHIGYAANWILVMFVQNRFGRPSPIFSSICYPSATVNVPIKITSCIRNENKYRKSFYSDIAALSMFSAVWLSLFLQYRLRPVLKSAIVVTLVQTLFLTIAIVLSILQYRDRSNYADDVLIGMIAGTTIAAYSIKNAGPKC